MMSAMQFENQLRSTRHQIMQRLSVYGAWLLLFSVAINLLMLSMPIYLTQVYERVLPSGSQETLLYLTFFIFICLALMGAIEVLRGNVAQKCATMFDLENMPDILRQTLGDGGQVQADPISLQEDVATIRQVIANRAVLALFDVPFTPIFLTILYLVHPTLGTLTSLGAAFLILLSISNEILARGKQKRAQTAQQRNRRFRNDLLRRKDDIRAMGMGHAMVQQATQDQISGAYDANAVAKVNGLFFGLVRFLRQAIQLGMLGVGSYLVVTDNLSAGLIFASSIVAGRALMPIEQLIGNWRQLSAARHAYIRLSQYWNEIDANDFGLRPFDLPPMQGFLRCQNLTLLPPGGAMDQAILNDISFAADPGQIIAIVGPSGAGKSSLLRLLATVTRPSYGTLEYDDFEARFWNPEQFGRSIGYCGQDISFFSGSVAQNIARFQPDAEDDEIVAAAKAAGVHEFIGELAGGYQTKLNNDQLMLSAGQRQRIALARALFRDPKVLLLDEPDAHLDQRGEAGLRKTILNAKSEGKLVIFASHKMNMINVADKVLVLMGGRVSAFEERTSLFRPNELENNSSEAMEPKQVHAQQGL